VIVLGLSGFEDLDRGAGTHPYTASRDADAPFVFREGRVPLQYFPLGLIGHDAAAALLVDGQLVAGAAEERFTRQKHGLNLAGRSTLPRRAIRYCLQEAGLGWEDVDLVAHYCRFTADVVARRLEAVGANLAPAERVLLEFEHARAFSRRVSPEVVRSQVEGIAGRPIPPDRFIAVPHHGAHAAGAFYSSGFEQALCLTLDGYGEEESARWWEADAGGLIPRSSVALPTSLGALYQLVTAYLGFRAFGDEYKTMGLAAYGDPARHRRTFAGLVALAADGGHSTATAWRPDLHEWLSDRLGPVPVAGGLCQEGADIAAGLQETLERAVLHGLDCALGDVPANHLCLAGGVGLNARMNGAILRSNLVKQLFVQPAAGDDGAALGAALWAWRSAARGDPAVPAGGDAEPGGRGIRHVYWGPNGSDAEIQGALAGHADRLVWSRSRDVAARAARALAAGRIVGWFQGRMELGPRALGGRSILASPASVALRDRLNEAVKGREPFRPFAPSVLAEAADRFFEIPDATAAPYMVVTYRARPEVRSRIPGVVHVDGTSRVQVVDRDGNPRYHELLTEFGRLTDLPVLLNTSFNRAGEPIVCTPGDAVACFLACGLDALAIGDYWVRRCGAQETAA
jgi:carbamoyltransferase